ncbi:MAG: Dabb family protein [Aquincola sp.]|nr:Dabb family protein [Aquincola sp.]
MFKHVVMWKLGGGDAAARSHSAARLKAEFESLRGRVPGLLHIEVGIDESHVDYACDVVLYTEFASRQALLDYAENPEHLRVRQRLGDMRTARHQVDYEVSHEAAHADRDPPLPAGVSAGHPPGDTDHVQALR